MATSRSPRPSSATASRPISLSPNDSRPIAVRPHHLQLLQRWLRDAEYRAGLGPLGGGGGDESRPDGVGKGAPRVSSFGFPHSGGLAEADPQAPSRPPRKSSATAGSSSACRADRQGGRVRQGQRPGGPWALLRDCGAFHQCRAKSPGKGAELRVAANLVRVYVDAAPAGRVAAHLLSATGPRRKTSRVGRVADRAYAAYALPSTRASSSAGRRHVQIPGLPGVTADVSGAGPLERQGRAVVIVDALRYDCAIALKQCFVTTRLRSSRGCDAAHRDAGRNDGAHADFQR